MCGIVAYTGSKQAYPILINGLHRLEYRGYDSAGIALLNKKIHLYKKEGKVADLENFINSKSKPTSTTGIGHTRWATHGQPNKKNAHPHFSQSEKMVIIHNGIIENYITLKAELENRGYTFKSETDTEVLIYLIEDIYQKAKVQFEEAVRLALNQVVGAYAIVLISMDEPNKLIAAKKSSPLVIGIGDQEYFIASDATPIIEHTRNVVYLKDEEIAIVESGKPLQIITTQNLPITPYEQELKMELERLEKGGYPHFMLKEIYEQPRSVRDSLRGRLDADTGRISMAGIIDFENNFLNANRIIIVGCGTSWHAALVGEYLIEELARIPIEVEYASEFRYRDPIIYPTDIVICISQSGETADTLAAVKLAKQKGAMIFGICNVVGSSIARATDAGAYTHAGPEIGVASTKAFTAQVAVLSLIALLLGKKKGMLTELAYRQLLEELQNVHYKIENVLTCNKEVEKIAKTFQNVSNFLYLGRGINFPLALEGALKLKEISYIHAEGYPAAEIKHGPIALIDADMPVVVLATKNHSYEKVVSNIQEVKARGGKIIAIITKGDTSVKNIADYCIEIPEIDNKLAPLLSAIPLQLLSYHIALFRGCNVDQPRNLAKSVTVE